MYYTVNRCIKRAGLIDRARTYCLLLNDDGLYILYLGKATGQMPESGDIITQVISDKAVNFFEQRYEKEISASEEKIKNGNLAEIAKEKHSFFLKKGQVQSFSFNSFHDGTSQIKIKGEGVKITLHAHNYYGKIIKSIEEGLK